MLGHSIFPSCVKLYLPTGHRLQNINGCASGHRCIETLQIADILTIHKNVHKWPQLTRFMTQVEPQARKVLVECLNDLTNCAASSHNRCAVTNPCTQCTRKEYPNTRDGG